MTIASTANRVSYTGNGVTTEFAYPYLFSADSDLVVVETVIATGVETTKAITTDYTITGASDPNGGVVTAVTAPAATVTWTIYRDPPQTQDADFVENDPLPSATLEGALDKLTMIAQRLVDRISRTIRQPDGDTADVGVLPSKVSRVGKFLSFDSNGDPLAAAGTSADLGPVSAYIDTLLDDADAAAARTTLGAAESGANADITSLSWLSQPVAIAQGGTAAATVAAALTSLGVPTRGYIDGLTLAPNGAAPTTTIDIVAGQARDSTDASTMALAAMLAKKASAAWAAGTGNGGLFTAAFIGAAARYHVFLIEKDTDGSIDAGFDTNATATNIPTGYTKYRRIGSIQTDGTGNVIGFLQSGDLFLWTTVPALDINDTTLSTTRKTYNLANVPSGVAVIAILNLYTPARLVYLSSPALSDQVPSATAAPLFHIGNVTGVAFAGAANFQIKTNASAQIKARADAATATLLAAVVGWIDPRGRDA